MSVHLVTASNARYMPKMMPYLDTLQANGAGLTRWLCCVDCDPPDMSAYPDIHVVNVPREALTGSPPETESLQHGGWLKYVPIGDEETVIFTDGDIFLQRPLSDAELTDLCNWKKNQLGASYNAGPNQTLLHEALYRLEPKIPDSEFLEVWTKFTLRCPCLNIGVMIAQKQTYAMLHKLYMLNWENITRHLQHQARQQWLMSYTAFAYAMNVIILPYTFHTHMHYDLPAGVVVGRAGDCYYREELVAFWHVPTWARGRAHV